MASFLNRVVFTASSGSTGSFIQGSSVTGYQLMAAGGALSGGTYGYAAQSTDLTQWEYGTGVWTSSNNTLTRTPLGGSGGSTALINFTNPPQVMITLLAQDAALAAAASNLTFWVNTAGNDQTAIPGSSTAPYATAQAAANAMARYHWGNQAFSPTIKFADGTYSAAASALTIEEAQVPGAEFMTIVGQSTNVILQDIIELNAANCTFDVGSLTFNVTGNSCLDVEAGDLSIVGPLVFQGNATPFYLEGPNAGMFCSGQTITVTSTEIPWFAYAGPGQITFGGVSNVINLPAALTVDNSFFEVHGYVDQVIQGGVSRLKLPTITWTNFGGVIGTNLIAQGLALILTQSGETSDIPGTNVPVYFDDLPVVTNFGAKIGKVLNTSTAPPTGAGFTPQNTQNVIWDTVGGGLYQVTSFSTVHTTPVGSYDLRQSSTANLTLNNTYAGWHFDNVGSTGEIDWSLPVPRPGMKFDFCNVSTNPVKVRSNDSTLTKIGTSSANSIGGGYISITNATASQFAYVGIEAISTSQYVVRYMTGAWVVSTGSTV